MSHPGAEGSLELLLRKLLLGEELVNTEFHLFSVRSSSSGRIIKPRVLCANNDLLAKNSKYFRDLLSSDIDPSDPSLRELTDDNDVPSECRIDDYGYGSDSDLEECEDPVSETSEVQSRTLLSPSSKNGAETDSNNGEDSSDDESDSDASDTFFMSSEHSSTDDQLPERTDVVNETSVKETPNNDPLAIPSALRLRSSRSRHVLVKDTAFQTWYTLLNYLSTGKVGFLPLRSATSGGRLRKYSSTANSLDKPRCSAKSMYHLACKVGLDNLRNQALACIRSNLTEHNILKEISCSLVARHRQLLDMELDVLFSCISSPSVIADFPAFVQRIINKELPHGADILLDIHGRFLKELRPLPSISMPPIPSLAPPKSPVPEPPSTVILCSSSIPPPFGEFLPPDPCSSFNAAFAEPPPDPCVSFNPSLGDPPPDPCSSFGPALDDPTLLNPPSLGGFDCSMPESVALEKEIVCEIDENEDDTAFATSASIKGKKGGLGGGGGKKMKKK